jgi:hypothetical protein
LLLRSGGLLVQQAFELDGREVVELGVSPAAVVEDLDELEDRVRELDAVFERFRSRSSICIVDENNSIVPLPNTSPTQPNEGMSGYACRKPDAADWDGLGALARSWRAAAPGRWVASAGT